MSPDRRTIFRAGLGGAASLPAFKSSARSQENLPAPSFNLVLKEVAGLRPWREDCYRLGAERFGERLVIHNYGHGGAGITMSWGCAHEVRDLVQAHNSNLRGKTVAVLGAGAMGLTAATLLREMGLRVRVYAQGFYDETTSFVAGGQFSPALVEFDDSAPGREESERILRRSFRSHEARIGQGYGVRRRPNYTFQRSTSFSRIPVDVVPEPQAVDRLPFEGHTDPGFVYETLLVEPPIFLAKLIRELRRQLVPLRRKTFLQVEEALALPEDILVNCLGLGAGEVFNDGKVMPIKGQLVLLQPDPSARYLYSGRGYIFPREDATVVGGSYEPGVDDPAPDPVKCREILAKAKRNFFPVPARTANVHRRALLPEHWHYSRD